MTEAEWLGSTDPQTMLEFLPGKASDRKLRLFAAACCRRIWPLLTDERSRVAVELVERLADGAAASQEWEAGLRRARNAVRSARRRRQENQPNLWAAMAATRALTRSAMAEAASQAALAVEAAKSWETRTERAPAGCFEGIFGPKSKVFRAWADERQSQCALLHDIVGNPFRSATLDPAWRTPAVRTLAQAAYDDRRLPSGNLDPARLATLGEALAEASCSDAELLSHLRDAGPHVRGCWAVDLLLGP